MTAKAQANGYSIGDAARAAEYVALLAAVETRE